ncbi:hypothetical protein GCM10022409_18840 [Hymenobacter glaciei]|uniref:Uncharacterized protein n=2 Tax=Hymenobacter glaciei TaxID=877209 RepID=A0ABP7U1U9_9BACT
MLLLLGSCHLVLTFFSQKFYPRQAETRQQMEQDSPVLTRESTVWQGWVGNHASHSAGMMFVGANTLALGLQSFDRYTHSPVLPWLTLGVCGFYVFLAQRYWFWAPLVGLMVATGCLLASWVLARG